MKREVIHVQLETAIGVDANQLSHVVRITWRAEGSHAHDLVLAFVDLESQESGEGAVEQAEGMGKPDLLDVPDVGSLADAEPCRHPLAHAVDGQDCRLLERRAEERTRGVREMMLTEKNLAGGD